ncbi:hypothetical protein BDW22DRAFT_1351412 [Trametopsis cervina]|nr:hypothetical protein BDW22DRAFT_1351412 [Trametopsis cervina]
MARNRKSQKSKTDEGAPLVEITEEDQWRIIRESGVLKTIPTSSETSPEAAGEELLSPFWLEFFAATALIIPHSFLLLMMEILAHYQYGRKPTLEAIADRMIPGIPIISIFVWYTNRYKQTRWMQAVLLIMGVVAGSRMIWVLNHANWKDVMRLSPPLATAWVYAVMQLDLGYALLSLLITGGFIWYKKLNIFPT